MKFTSITPFLWFEQGARAAAEHYVEVFEDSEILTEMPGPGDEPLGVTIRIGEQKLTLFNGGEYHKLDEAFSLMVVVETQEQVDYYWNALTDGGRESMCGWLEDRHGVSWQITPSMLMDSLRGENPEASARAHQAMLQMQKLDIAELQAAYDGN